MTQKLFFKEQNTIVFIVGPTASGKSALGLRLAQKLGGEIVCADSQTIRKGLTIGTAKPTPEEQKLVPHHMLDIIEPFGKFNVADFVGLAKVVIKDIQDRGRVPIVVGGTGLYTDALFFNYTLLPIQPSDTQDGLDMMSVDELQALLLSKGYKMPQNKRNKRHLIGVIRRGGASASDTTPIPGAYMYALQWPDSVLKARITDRVEAMCSAGLVGETKAIMHIHGIPPANLDAICYPLVARYIAGEINLPELKELIARADWQYVRRQKSWLRRNKFVQWLDPENDPDEYILKDILVV